MLFFPLMAVVLLSTFEYGISAQEKENDEKTKKSSLVFGYQIGGLGYLGADYEYKFNKVAGIHAGIGYSSFTGGFKFHLSNCVTCPFLNISFKDKEFGEFGTLGAEFSANLLTYGEEIPVGLFIQFGYGYIVYISEKKKIEMYGNENPPEGIFTFGIGMRINW